MQCIGMITIRNCLLCVHLQHYKVAYELRINNFFLTLAKSNLVSNKT